MPATESSEQVPTVLAAELMTSISAVRRQVRRRATRNALGEGPLLPAQTELLRLIIAEPGKSVATLADRLHVAPSTVSTLIRRLLEHEFVTRHTDKDDRRVARFCATEAGREYSIVRRDQRVATLAQALSELRPEDLSSLVAAIPVFRVLAEILS